MTSSPAPINLDKLRNAVQRFGRMSFTTSQLAADYHRGDESLSAPETALFDELLRRHAPLLGIAPQPASAGGDTVWLAL